MGLETSTTINGLNALWPLGTDPRAEGDNHLRLIKSVLQAVFDDSTAGRLKFKVARVDFAGEADKTAMRLYDTNGTTVRAILYANAGTATTGQLRMDAYDSAFVLKNSLIINEFGMEIDKGGATGEGPYTIRNAAGAVRGQFRADITAGLSASIAAFNTSSVEQISWVVSPGSGQLWVTTNTAGVLDIVRASDGTVRSRRESDFNQNGHAKLSAMKTDGTTASAFELVENKFRMYGGLSVEYSRRDASAIKARLDVQNSGSGEIRWNVMSDASAITGFFGQSQNSKFYATADGYQLMTLAGLLKAQLGTDLGNANGWGSYFVYTNAGALGAGWTVDNVNFMWQVGPSTSYRVVTEKEINKSTSATVDQYGLKSHIMVFTGGVGWNRNTPCTPCFSSADSLYFRMAGLPSAGTPLTGTWQVRGMFGTDYCVVEKTAL